MATLYLHVGQAGCQLGQSFWTPLVDEISNSETLQLALCHRANDGRQQTHRSIFVDTESKALHDAARAIGAKRIGANVRFGVSGRGSCFPMGFGQESSRNELDDRFDFVRQEVEKCEYTSCFVMTHSLGGGTGSGFGTRLFSWLKDSFPLVNLMAISCAGFALESPVQNYNSVLAFSRLQSLCDGLVLFNNEHIVENASKEADILATMATSNVSTAPSSTTDPSSRRTKTSGSSLRDINRKICLSLHGAFLPAASVNPSGARLQSGASISFNTEPLELIRTLAPMPSLNVMQMDSVMQARDKTRLDHVQSLCRAVKRPWKVGSSEGEKLSIARLTAITRNGAVMDDDCVKKLTSSLPFVSWNPFPVDVWRGDDSFCVPRLKPSKHGCLTACSNSNRFVPLARSWTEKTRRLLNAGAFVHWS